jgi:hypothetical protein
MPLRAPQNSGGPTGLIKTTLYVQTVPKGGPRHSMGGVSLGT